MPNKQYVNCDRLINGIDFELDCVELCCFRCHKGAGNIELAKVVDGKINIDELQKNRIELISKIKSGTIPSKCEGCFNLEQKQWDETPNIKYIHFNHWTQCNSDCIYCYTKKDKKYGNGVQHYRALPILKEILNHYKFSPDGEITFAGGEPLLLDEFDEIIDYLIEIGAKKIIVHTSGSIYSESLSNALKKGIAKVVISQDAGFEETYKKIKNTDLCSTVWKNTHLYSTQLSDAVLSKYVIIPKVNDSKKEIDEWLKKSAKSGVQTVILDIEHDYYNENTKNIKNTLHLLSLCEYVYSKAEQLGLNVELYNAARYLYQKYKKIAPFLRYKNYFLNLLMLASPILMGSIGHSIVGATDVLVVAKYSIDALAAVSIANAFLFTIFIFGIGLQDAISIILSNKRGKREGVKKYLNTTIVYSLFLAILFTVICYSTVFLIDKISFEAKLVPYIKEYIKIASFSMFGVFIFQGIKQFLQSYEIVKIPNFIIVVSAIINLFLDIAFVFGFGNIIPSMGVKGAALATLISRTFMGMVIFLYVVKSIRIKQKINFSLMNKISKVGMPIGLGLLVEFLAFNIVTILIGRESGLLAAIHNILITITSLIFNVPLSLSIAVAVKVAYNCGAKKYDELRKYSYTGILMSVSFMSLCSVLLALYPSQILGLFTKENSVITVALPIIFVTAMYQVFDGFQAVMGGVLKGFKMTKAASLCVFSGYWLVGMPVAYLLVYKYSMSLKGYWIALAVSLCSIGLFEAVIAKYKFKKIRNTY